MATATANHSLIPSIYWPSKTPPITQHKLAHAKISPEPMKTETSAVSTPRLTIYGFKIRPKPTSWKPK